MNHRSAYLVFALTLAAGLAHADERLAGIACRSVHLHFPAPDAVAFYNEVTVTQSAEGTYFMACGFHMGYFGMQELRGGKKVVLFSVWDPGRQNDPSATPEDRRVKVLSQGDGVRVRRFGGEGTGGQSFYDYDWQLGETCRFLVASRPDGDRTAFTGYLYVAREKRWQQMATFSTLAGGRPIRGCYSFVEDFRRNRISTTKARAAEFGNAWVKTTDGQWHALDRARFTADSNPSTNINAGVRDGRFFLATGGETKNVDTPLGDEIQLPHEDRLPPEDLPATDLNEQRIRVLSYNIKHGLGNDGRLDLQRAADVINRLEPDLVALQEIDNQVARSGSVDQAATLGELTGMHAAFGKFFDYQGGEYGMAILSRTPILASENRRLPDGAEPRSSLVATVRPRASGPEILVACVHFYATASERLAQAEKLLETLAEEQRPIIIAGDFNSQPGSPVLQLFASAWTIPDKGEDRYTFSAQRPRREIDFILFRPRQAFEVGQIVVLDEPVVSDHRPVFVDLIPPHAPND